jgi:hypothetical protein
MTADALRDRILDDESLTGDLDEGDATVAVAWALARAAPLEGTAGAAADVDALCRRLRAAGKVHAAIRDGDTVAAATWAARAGITVPGDGPDLIHRLLSQLELPPPGKS